MLKIVMVGIKNTLSCRKIIILRHDTFLTIPLFSSVVNKPLLTPGMFPVLKILLWKKF